MKFRSVITSIIFYASLCVFVFPALADNPALSAPIQPKEPAVISLNGDVDVICPVIDGMCNGQISNITNGTIEMFSLVPVDEKNLVINFGYGTVVSRENIGELFSFAGRNYIRTTAPNTAPKLLLTYQTVRTPLSVGIYDRSAVKPLILHVNYLNPVSLQALMNQAVQDIQNSVIVLGWVEMPLMKGEALKRAPIDGVSLIGDKRSDYIEPVTGQNIRVIFSALAIPAKAVQSVSSSIFSEKIFNSGLMLKDKTDDTNALIFAKAALTDDAMPADYYTSPLVLKKMNAANVKDICTLLPDSTISKGILIFYQPILKKMSAVR